MMPEDSQKAVEKEILRNQYIAVVIMFVLFFASALVSILVFGNDMVKIMRVVIPVANLPLLFIGLSSLKNKVSILRPRGKRTYSTGKQAVIVGSLALVVFLLNIVIVFSPILPFLFDAMLAAT